ncbi:hypothetical protein [Stenotrophomonas sp. PSU-St7]
MKKITRVLLLAGLGLLANVAWAGTTPSSTQCSPQAVAQAKRLLAFHTDGDERAEVEGPALPLPSIVNPADSKQRFDVLEVWGYVYRGSYRMRLEYCRSGGGCVLMGQEILEIARL